MPAPSVRTPDSSSMLETSSYPRDVFDPVSKPIRSNVTPTTIKTAVSGQKAGWTEMSNVTMSGSGAQTDRTGTKSASPPPSSSPDPTASPIHIKIQNQMNYNIVNNITVKVGSQEDEDDDATNSAPGAMVPRPPETARPSTSTHATKPNPSTQNSNSQQQQHHHHHQQQQQPPRPNTAAAGVKPSQQQPSKPVAHTPAPPPSLTPAASGVVGGDKATAVSHYAVGKTIGEGTFGKVKAGIHKLTGLPVAIKILEKERIVDLADVERVKREIHILTRVRHPNVIRLFEVIDSPRHIFLIMENCSGGELFDYIVSAGRVKEDQACRFFHQILNGTDYFHNKSIIHRDLKPENLLLDYPDGPGTSPAVKIVDFGLGNVVKPGKLLKTACGSPCYAAPEMIAGKRYVGPGADMWSLGVVLFALLCGYLPFEDSNTARLYEKIMAGEYELPDFLSSDSKDLISKLLTTDPRKRYNAEQVRRHSWYSRLSVASDPAYTQAELDAPVVPGPQASGRKVKRTIGGQVVDDEGTQVDAEVIRHMTMLGYHPQQVQESIQSNRHDHFAATYHLLLIKKSLAAAKQAAAQGGKPSASRPAIPPSVPRIPIASGSAGGPQVPSAPVTVHHPHPPAQKQQGYARPAQATGATAGVGVGGTPGQQPPVHPSPPAQAFSATTPLSSPPPSHPQPSHSPQPPASVSARVQSAGTVRPSPPAPSSSSAAGAPSVPAYPASARPGTSYHQAHKEHPAAQAWTGQEAGQAQAQGPPMGLGVANGVNGGAGVNAYMQFQAQAAALYASTAGAVAQAYYRPPSSSPNGRQTPSGSGSAPKPPPVPQAPSSARAPSRGSYRAGAKGRAGAKVSQPKGPQPTVPQTLFVSSPLDSIAAPVYASAAGSPSSHRTVSAAVGPATGRPMTSRITGSTGGVSHRLYFPPSERAAHDLAMAQAAAAVASRPGTSSGVRPGSSAAGSRPGTSGGSQRRPPSGQRNTPRGYGASAKERARSRERMSAGLDEDLPLEELEWTQPSSSKQSAGQSSTAANSSFNNQLSAMSFKPIRSIMDEIQRVLHSNSLTYSILPPSGAGISPTSPLGKHGFVPGALGTPSAAANLAPISISSLRPQPRPSLDPDSVPSSNQVIEVRQGQHRFQFHVAPLSGASAGLASKLAADLDSEPIQAGGHTIRIKRVLGDAQSFRDICSKILPQLKL